jgi:pyruvate dehydrogenase (quinone)
MAGDPEYEASQNLPDFPYAAYAEMIGLKGVKVDKPEDVARGWEEVLSADRPAVYEVVVDPNVPTVPPHFTFEQMVKFSKTLIKGDPKQRGIIRQTFKEVMDSIRH